MIGARDALCICPARNVLFRLGMSAAQRLDPALASKTKSYAIDVRHMETFVLETVAKAVSAMAKYIAKPRRMMIAAIDNRLPVSI